MGKPPKWGRRDKAQPESSRFLWFGLNTTKVPEAYIMIVHSGAYVLGSPSSIWLDNVFSSLDALGNFCSIYLPVPRADNCPGQAEGLVLIC